MVESVIGILVSIALVGLFVFLTVKAFKPRRTILKGIGGVLAGLLALVLAALTVVGVIGFTNLYLPATPEVAEFSVEGTPDQIARGEHIATIVCSDCHTQNGALPLAGGMDFGEDAPFPMGSIPAYNLTPAGPLANWSNADIYRAIRYNVDPDGRRLAVMASTGLSNLSDEDTRAVIAYLRSQPAVGGETRQEKLTYITTLLSGIGMVPIRTNMGQVAPVAPADSPEYGKYLVDFLSCGDCHGEQLTGGAGGLFPAGPSLVNGVPSWTEEQFMTAIRTGVRPYGPPLNPDMMPWPTYGNMDDTELAAVYAYLVSLAGE